MLVKSIATVRNWVFRALRAYFTDLRVSIPATLGAMLGFLLLDFLERFNIPSNPDTPQGLPELCFRFVVVVSFAVVFAAMGKRALDHYLPRQ